MTDGLGQPQPANQRPSTQQTIPPPLEKTHLALRRFAERESCVGSVTRKVTSASATVSMLARRRELMPEGGGTFTSIVFDNDLTKFDLWSTERQQRMTVIISDDIQERLNTTACCASSTWPVGGKSERE